MTRCTHLNQMREVTPGVYRATSPRRGLRTESANEAAAQVVAVLADGLAPALVAP